MRFSTAFLFCVAICINSSAGVEVILDAIKTVVEEATGIVKAEINSIPNISEVLDAVKQTVLGLPFTLLLSTVDDLCTLALSQDSVPTYNPPNISEVQFQFRSACNRYSYPVLEAEKIVENAEFNATRKTVLVVTGWMTTANNTIPDTMDILAKAYNCRGDYNFLGFDDSHYLQGLYTWSVINTQLLARHMAIGLQHLAEVVPYESIHLIGHSLGAHIVGAAGRHFTELTGNTLKHITGLEPAKPCFDQGDKLHGIFRGDAEFVDIIHTTPGTVGEKDPVGDVDFYAGGYRPLKPGCLEVVCSHNIVGDYYAETVYPNNAYDFMARRCTSLSDLRNGLCEGDEMPMGFAVPYNSKGNYFLEVNANEPYGLNATDGFQSSETECGNCPL